MKLRSFIIACIGALVMTLLVIMVPDVNEMKGASGQQDMKALLKEIDASLRYPEDFTNNTAGVAYYQNLLKTVSEENKKEVTINLVIQYILTGQTAESIKIIEQLLAQPSLDENATIILKSMLALSYLREGELNNCYKNHNEASCIMPFSSRAFHADKHGAEEAAKLYLEILSKRPEDRHSRWLLNIAYMALGEYPAGVPKQFFVDFDKYSTKGTIGRFPNIASKLGIDRQSHLGGICMDDFNNDGTLDLFVTSFRLNENVGYYQNLNGKMTDVTAAMGLNGITGGANCMQADFDNDGWKDILIVRGGWQEQAGFQPKSLLHNLQGKGFEDVTQKAGLMGLHPSHSACWADINNDGWLDLFVGNEEGNWVNPPDSVDHFSELFLNKKDGTFENISQRAGVVVNSFVKGCAWFDYNNDGLADLYVSNYKSKNLLYRNDGLKNGVPVFTEVAEQAGVSLPVFSFSVNVMDFNNDGWQDLLVPGYDIRENDLTSEYIGDTVQHMPKLFINNHDGTFTDIAEKANLRRSIYAMGLNSGDIDNDGYPDFYAATGYADLRGLFPNLMFRNVEGKYFEDVTTATGTGHLQKGHGVAIGDIDNDGDNDVFAVMGGFFTSDFSFNTLFENPGNTNNWIGLELQGQTVNRSAIGAKIVITASGPAGEKTFYKWVTTGGSYGSSPLQLVTGLGKYNKISSLEITWQGDQKQVIKVPAVNQYYHIVQNNPEPHSVSRIALKLAPADSSSTSMPAGHHHHH
jgi:hypothetical protein